MGVFASHDIRIVNNVFSGNGLGIHVEDSTNNLIKGNVISDNEQPGIFMQADRNEIRRNTCRRNGICILVGPGSRNVVMRNRVVGDGDGIEKGRHNVVVRISSLTRLAGVSALEFDGLPSEAEATWSAGTS
jgi:parallel beta-helix repeat protein